VHTKIDNFIIIYNPPLSRLKVTPLVGQ